MLVGVVVGVVKVVSITDVSVVGSPIPRNTKVVRPSRIYTYIYIQKFLRFPYKHCKVPFVVDLDVDVLVTVVESSVVDVFMVVVVIEVDVPRLVAKVVVARVVVGGSSSEMG